MMDKFKNFFRNKFNISLVIIQVIAIVSYFLSSVVSFLSIAFFAGEGIFFLILGIKILCELKAVVVQQEILDQMPYSDMEKVQILKKNESIRKNNKFLAIIFIIFGAVLFFSIFTLFF